VAQKENHYLIIETVFPIRLDLYVKLKKSSSTITLSVGNEYSLLDLIFDVNNYA